MFICLDCGKLFEEPKRYIERHGLDYAPYEAWKGCPECGGAYVETFECTQCGKWITGDYIEIGDTLVCDECYQMKSIED